MTIELTDDGTLDTVVRCSECGEEYRFTYQSGPGEDDIMTEQAALEAYDAYVAECIAEIDNEHECNRVTA